jgi:hypothetical protein
MDMADPDDQIQSNDRAVTDISSALSDWFDFDRTPRKIIARRLAARRFEPLEHAAMRAARQMMEDGMISIVVRHGVNSLGRPMITYIAERAK